MYANHYMDVEEKEVTLEGVKNTTIRWLVSPKVGAKNFAMRYFVIKKGGTIPIHQHDWEHEIFVIKGEGYLTTDGKNLIKAVPGSFFYVPPNEPHGYINEDSETFEFLCIIPAKKEAIPESEWVD
ncbi:cupin domain-containing protein [Palaeococcus sp. (in: euryarchaeotes)]|nr:MAG: cupin domain-containing protein [Thermococci archaeon]